MHVLRKIEALGPEHCTGYPAKDNYLDYSVCRLFVLIMTANQLNITSF